MSEDEAARLRGVRHAAHWYVHDARSARLFWEAESLLEWLREDAKSDTLNGLDDHYRHAIIELDERGELAHLVGFVCREADRRRASR